MKKVIIIEGIRDVMVNCPPNAYQEKFIIGRYTVHAVFLPKDGYMFYLFRNNELRAIISNDEWFISRLDGEGQNLLNRLMRIFG